MLIDTTYFYAPPGSFSKGKVFLEGDEVHHLVDVLRAKPGDVFIVTDGEGTVFRCRLEKVHKKGAVAEVLSRDDMSGVCQPGVRVCLALGVIRAGNMETALDWCVQLGLAEFVPILADFSQGEKKVNQQKMERFKKIAVRAIKQAKRAILPKIHEACTVVDFLKQCGRKYDGILFADPDGVPSVPKRMTVDGSRICVFVGPEGGFSSAERAELSEYGAVPLSLGAFRLRTETAAVAALVKILVWSGNI